VRKIYRVTVAAVNYDDEGNFVSDETLFEATHHRPESLLRFAPSEVDDALRIVANVPPTEAPRAAEPLVDREALAGEVAARLREPEAADVAVLVCDGPAPAKRKRRTKAEIEADRIREAAASDPQREVKDALAAGAPVELPDAPQAVDEPLPAHEHAGSADSTPAAPWNPFQTR
jgi:hypothetical protein